MPPIHAANQSTLLLYCVMVPIRGSDPRSETILETQSGSAVDQTSAVSLDILQFDSCYTSFVHSLRLRHKNPRVFDALTAVAST